MCDFQAMDYLAIGVHELANISERRIERLINPGMYSNTSTSFTNHCEIIMSLNSSFLSINPTIIFSTLVNLFFPR